MEPDNNDQSVICLNPNSFQQQKEELILLIIILYRYFDKIQWRNENLPLRYGNHSSVNVELSARQDKKYLNVSSDISEELNEYWCEH